MTIAFLIAAATVPWIIWMGYINISRRAYQKGKRDGVEEFKNQLSMDRSGLALKHLEMEVIQKKIGQ